MREKEIISTDNETDETGGAGEFVVMDRISVGEEKLVVVMKAKRSSIGEAMKQCLLAMKDARDNNGGGEVYGFVTGYLANAQIQWEASNDKQNRRTIRYDGRREREQLVIINNKWLPRQCQVIR